MSAANSECVIHDGYVRDGRYGQRYYRGKNRYAHRVVYAEHHSIDIDGPDMPPVVMHTCDNPPCVNPDHLKGGTQADNLADMREKGRQAQGETQGNTKLTNEQVREMRRRYKDGGVTQKQLAAEFGLGHVEIYRILKRERWAHV